jgi:hypothetical protein
MAVDPRTIGATAEFSESEAPVRLEFTREGAAETSAGPDAGDRATAAIRPFGFLPGTSRKPRPPSRTGGSQ